MQLSPKARAFLAQSPTLIGHVAGHAFYKHPTQGDHSPLIQITPEGKVHLSNRHHLPEPHDLT